VALLLDEYRHFFSDLSALGTQLDCLVALHGREKVGAWKDLAVAGEWAALVARLLEEHYDPAYRRSASHNYPRLAGAEVLRVDSPGEAAFARLAQVLLHDLAAPLSRASGGTPGARARSSPA
jgi:tRNA 2-selenouridine synthase